MYRIISRRKQLAIAAFKNMQTIFIRRQKISEERRLRLYNALVLPVLTYNCGTWALTEQQQKATDAFHRKQLRILLGIFYPEKISKKELYKRCNTEPLGHFITRQTWLTYRPCASLSTDWVALAASINLVVSSLHCCLSSAVCRRSSRSLMFLSFLSR